MIDGGQPWRRSIFIIFGDAVVADLLNIFLCCRTFGDNLIYTDWQRDNYFRAVKVKYESTSQLEAIKMVFIRLWQESLGDVKGNIGVEFDHMNLETKRFSFLNNM